MHRRSTSALGSVTGVVLLLCLALAPAAPAMQQGDAGDGYAGVRGASASSLSDAADGYLGVRDTAPSTLRDAGDGYRGIGATSAGATDATDGYAGIGAPAADATGSSGISLSLTLVIGAIGAVLLAAVIGTGLTHRPKPHVRIGV